MTYPLSTENRDRLDSMFNTHSDSQFQHLKVFLLDITTELPQTLARKYHTVFTGMYKSPTDESSEELSQEV